MKKTLTLTLALVFCLGLVTTTIDAKPARGESAPRANWQGVHSWLGVYTQTVDEDLADAFGIDVEYGAIVNEVIDDSPAEDAGLKDGDVITSFDGKKVWDKDDLIDYLEDSEPGSTVSLGVIRNKQEMTVSVELGKKPRTSIVAPNAPRTPRISGDIMYFDMGHDGHDDYDIRSFSGHGSGYVGIQLSEVTVQLAEYFGVKDGNGALITEVVKESPAEKAGLKAGDVITRIGDESVKGYAEVKKIVSETDDGKELAFTIVRNKKMQEVKVVVEENEINGYDYGIFSVPSVPDIDVRVPRGILRYNSDDKNGNAYFDFDNYKDSMEKFREEMKKYKDEMRELSKEMNGLKKEDQSNLKEQIRELREQIRELEKKIQ